MNSHILTARWFHGAAVTPLRRNGSFDFRNPPPFWRRACAGVALALPGAVAGLILAVLLGVGAAAWFGAAGLVLGFLAGFRMEKY